MRGAFSGRSAGLAAGVSGLEALFQLLDADLTALAALSTTAFGRSLLEAADAAAARTLIGADVDVAQTWMFEG